MIKIDKISKIYRNGTVATQALTDVSFSVTGGEFVAIMGPSGSGKSTLMHIIGALDTPTAGTYELDGEEVGQLDDDELAEIRNKKIGFVFQAFNLLPRVTALKNVVLPMAYGAVPKERRMERAKHLLDIVGLADRIDYKSNQLSGGQQQRVAIARALTMEPKILLADEPTGNLASTQAGEIMDIFQRLNKDGHTIVMITHEPDIAGFARRIITLRDGEIESDRKNGERKEIKYIRKVVSDLKG